MPSPVPPDAPHVPAPTDAPGQGSTDVASPATGGSGESRPLDPAVAAALLRPDWRARWDDLTGGWGVGPGAAALAVVALAAVVAVALGPWGADDGPSATASLPMVEPSGAASDTAPRSDGVAGSSAPTSTPAPGAARAPGDVDGGAGGNDVGVAGGGDVGVVVVHASGAVAVPGVHRLPAGARVGDLVAQAGGSTAEADLDRVNLAAPLVDGTRVHVPRVGEEVVPAADAARPADVGSGVAATGGVVGAPVGPISLSRASQAELESLPGVGPATAMAIIEHRRVAGGFTAVDQLLDVRGIGETRLEQLRPLVMP